MYQLPMFNIKRIFKGVRILLEWPSDIWLIIISYYPGPVGFRLRYRYWKKRLRHLGKDVRIDTGVYLQNPNYISIDDCSWIDKNVVILAGLDKSEREKYYIANKEFQGEPGLVYIGKNIHIGPSCIISGISSGVHISDKCSLAANCKIYAFTHHFRSKEYPKNKEFHFSPLVPDHLQCIIEGPVYLGMNTGVALNSIILPGVFIPNDCFVAINSVVKAGPYRENSIISGSPAKSVAERFKSDE
jgi:acetyltransferase-like isoleucine patch superfamily enzyme